MKPEMFPTLALHTLLEFHGCDPFLLKNAEALRPIMLDAVRAGKGTIVTEIFHTFSPHGVSGVIVISESHVAIHTWPEHAFAAVDIFSCSSALDQVKIEECIQRALRATNVTRRIFQRGPMESEAVTETNGDTEGKAEVLAKARIGVGAAHWFAPPLPPNRTGGFPASGFPEERL